jgi:dihydroflavonol-4-reductase
MSTVLLTGLTGFIAKHIALQLLQAGHTVRGTARSPERLAEVQAALAPHLPPGALDRLSVVPADLLSDDGWAAAAQGCDVLMHTASPFPIAQPKDPADLIRPAVDGTLRAMRAAHAAGITRMIVTSSVAAVYDETKGGMQDESDWLNPDAPGTTAYSLSKLRAEQAAWAFAAEHPEVQLTTINPTLVLGPPLDRHYGSSLGLVERILRGRDPAVPHIGFGLVDVRDVARMHVVAMETPATAGRRYIGSAESMWMDDMAAALKSAYPDRRIPTRVAPAWLLRILALWDRDVRTILPRIGVMDRISNARARAEMGIEFRPADQALRDAAEWLVRNGAV